MLEVSVNGESLPESVVTELEVMLAVVDLLEDVVKRHPEIEEKKQFECPYFQRLAELVRFFDED